MCFSIFLGLKLIKNTHLNVNFHATNVKNIIKALFPFPPSSLNLHCSQVECFLPSFYYCRILCIIPPCASLIIGSYVYFEPCIVACSLYFCSPYTHMNLVLICCRWYQLSCDRRQVVQFIIKLLLLSSYTLK